ncbi:MAG TPA: YHS domain-containing protein [Vicinamibacterales bacterium]|nr:YHS domain-containing protein [Vicinamibacterales bacterium]
MEGLLSLLLFAGLFYVMMRFGCGAHMVHGHGGHGEHGGETPEPTAEGASALDPVCGMTVAADQGYTRVFEGRRYRFCSRICLDKFEASPQSYVAGGVR